MRSWARSEATQAGAHCRASSANDVLSHTSRRGATGSLSSTVAAPTRTVIRAGAAPGPPWAAPVVPIATQGTCTDDIDIVGS